MSGEGFWRSVRICEAFVKLACCIQEEEKCLSLNSALWDVIVWFRQVVAVAPHNHSWLKCFNSSVVRPDVLPTLLKAKSREDIFRAEKPCAISAVRCCFQILSRGALFCSWQPFRRRDILKVWYQPLDQVLHFCTTGSRAGHYGVNNDSSVTNHSADGRGRDWIQTCANCKYENENSPRYQNKMSCLSERCEEVGVGEWWLVRLGARAPFLTHPHPHLFHPCDPSTPTYPATHFWHIVVTLVHLWQR